MLRQNASGSLDSFLSQVPSLFLMSLIVIGLTLLNALFNSLASSVGLGYPYSTFLFKPWDVFGDLFKMALSYPGPPLPPSTQLSPLFVGHASSGGISNLNAPPLIALIYILVRYALTEIEPFAVLAIVVGAWVAPLGLLIFTHCRSRFLAATVLCALLISYPALLAITRGNVGAGVTAVALITAITLTHTRKAPLIAAMMIAIAINTRPNAIVFVLLPFIACKPREAIKYAAFSLALSILIAIVSFFAVHALYAAYTLSSFSRAIGLYYVVYVIGDWGWAYGSSFFGLAKAVVRFFQCDCDLGTINRAIALTWGGTLLIAAALFKCRRIGERDLIFVLCAVYTLASSVFADYHLIVFFCFFLIYANFGNVAWGQLPPADKVILICAALMLAPKNYVFFQGWVSAQVLMNPIILAIGVVLVMVISIRKHTFAS